MSLDVYLDGDKCDACKRDGERYYRANITHNLNTMAAEAGIYEALWRPEEIGVTKAAQLIPLLDAGLSRLCAQPDRFRAFDAPNGWGTYEGLVSFVEKYLAACKEFPEANVRVWR